MFDMADIKKNVGKLKGGERDDEPREAPRAFERTSKSSKGPAVIGPSIVIKGDLSGEEDLVIEGRVEGEINLKQHDVTIGRNGRIRANVYASSISVEGELQGDLIGDEKVVIRKTGNVKGNIVSPRVNLEEGAKFKGSIEMEPKAAESLAGSTRPGGELKDAAKKEMPNLKQA